MRVCNHGSAPGRCGFPGCRYNRETLVPSNHARLECERCGVGATTVQRGSVGQAFFPEHVCSTEKATAAA